MTKFIKLTEAYGNDKVREIYVNAANIQMFQVGNKGCDTMIVMMNKQFYFVKEKVKQILELIDTDYSKSPIIMTADEAVKLYKAKDRS